MPDITLYYAPGACSLAPHAVLNEIGVAHKLVKMKYVPQASYPEDGSMTAEEYRKIHPSSYVPGFTIDGQVITENTAILSHLATLAPERQLAGKNDLDRARVLEWLAYLSGTVHGWGFGMLYAPQRYTDDEKLYEAVRQKGRVKIQDCYDRINQRLEGRDFAVGDADTVADFYLLVFYSWGTRMDFDMSGYTNYGRVMRRMGAKESVKLTFKQEDKELGI